MWAIYNIEAQLPQSCPRPTFGQFERDLVFNTGFGTVGELFVRLSVCCDVDLGRILLFLDLARLDKFPLLGTDLLQQHGCRFVVRILRDELAAYGKVKNAGFQFLRRHVKSLLCNDPRLGGSSLSLSLLY